MAMRTKILFLEARGKTPTMSIYHWAKGHGLVKEIKSLAIWWMRGEKRWYFVHLRTYIWASFCMRGHQYPWVRAQWANDLPSKCSPQMSSWISNSTSSTKLEWTHSRSLNMIFCTSLRRGRSRTALLLSEVCAPPFFLLAAYHGV